MKDIVIIANFCRDFSESDNGRFMYLCKELSLNNQVEIITSDFNHITKKHRDELTIKWPFKITFLHEPEYPTNVCLQRFFSHHVWGKEVLKYLEHRQKPDVIYCAMPSLTAANNAASYCRKNGIRFIIDIQDLWPEAFKMVFHIPVLSDLIFKPLDFLANKVYCSADDIIAVSQTYADRALKVNKKIKHGYSVYLGTDLDTFDAYVKENLELDKPCEEIWIGYCGTLGASYDISCVIDSLCILKSKGISNLKFIVMGDGPKRTEFEKHAIEIGINAVFTGRLSYPAMCGKLAACNIVVNPISHRAAQSIINKHSDYAASGLPVVSTQECKEYRQLVEDYNMGFNCLSNDATDLAEKLLILINDSQLRTIMGKNARRCAEDKFDRKISYKTILYIVEGVIR